MTKKVQRSNMTATDSKGRVLREPRDNSSGEAVNFKWETLEGSAQAQAIVQTIAFIQQHQGSRIEQLTVSTRLYGSSSVYNMLGGAFTRASSINSNPSSQRISYNLCQSVIDTLVSKIAKNKVVPTYVTNGGIWEVQKKAKDLTKFTQGLFYQEKVHRKMVDAFRDGGVWGDGFVHVFESGGKCVVERVLPHEITVDQVEALTTEPRKLYRTKIMDRAVAIDLWPDCADEIMSASPANYQEIGGQGTSADLVTVYESWCLPSGPDAKNGKHVICCGDTVLNEDDTEYDKDYFPFPHFSYSERLMGYFSQGACERLQNIQGEVNRSMIVKQRSLWMQGSFKVLLENGSKIVTQHLNNDVGALIHYTGTPPSYVTPPATNPELQQWIDSLIEKGYRQEGVSQMSASALKPMGVDSGKAMRTLTDIEDDRFLFIEQQIEAFALEIARQAIEVVKDIYKKKKTYKVVFPSTQFMETVDWKDISLDDDQYVLKAFPTSALSKDISGRLSDVQELAQAGFISARTANRLMDMPDVEVYESLTNAPEDLLHKIFEGMLNGGDYMPPEPFYDLTLAKQLVNEYYNYAAYLNCPQDRLALLEQFNSHLDDIANQAAAAQAAAQAPKGVPGGPPQAAPEAPPTSNLLPNAPGGQAA